MVQDVSFDVLNNNGDAVQVGAWRFVGDGHGPTVHLQAGVHADEIAGMLVLHLLIQRLHVAEAQGRFKGSVTVVPQANPLGIGQFFARADPRAISRCDRTELQSRIRPVGGDGTTFNQRSSVAKKTGATGGVGGLDARPAH